MTKFDLYKGTSKVQSSVDSPIVISDLTPETQYDDYSVSYAGNEEKTPVSFKTEAQKKVSVTGVTVSPKTIAMKVGEAKQVAGVISPESATNKGMTYLSENEAIVTVAS
ncbi:Ig domain protein group 2 domain protein, partial [Weissella oryzae SG25]